MLKHCASPLHEPWSLAPPRRVLVLSNPGARRGGAGIEPALDRLRAAGIAVRSETFSGADEIASDILRLAHEADALVLCGGDGTLNGAASAVIETGLPMGILPMGTANDLARTLGVPDDLEKAADLIAAGGMRAIDVGLVNERPFFNVASIGMSVELARSLTPDLKRRWGRLGYAVAGMRVLARARRFTAWIAEGEETIRTKTLQIAVGNGVHYGGGNVVEESAKSTMGISTSTASRCATSGGWRWGCGAFGPGPTARGPTSAPPAATSSRFAPAPPGR